ncbi:MAG: class I glutamine amidotransferase-like protein [Linnemannia elongata]|nr:MAG: class I glutamine amidotransferase-like protein [Linnemannia elongata]
MTKKILFVLTSHDQLGNSGQQTGWYAEEVAEPATVLYRNGYEIVYASPKGGKAPLDKGSIEAAKNNPNTVAFLANKDYQHKVDNTHKISEFIGRESEFDAIIYPGGHGPMFDLEHDESALKLTAAAYEAGKVVGAICHGPIALSDVVLKDGTYMIKGKNVTSFSDDEERQVQKDHLMPVLLETKLKQRGAHYHKAAQPWGEKIVTDGLIVTGQNPGSAPAFGEAILAAIQATAH